MSTSPRPPLVPFASLEQLSAQLLHQLQAPIQHQPDNQQEHHHLNAASSDEHSDDEEFESLLRYRPRCPVLSAAPRVSSLSHELERSLKNALKKHSQLIHHNNTDAPDGSTDEEADEFNYNDIELDVPCSLLDSLEREPRPHAPDHPHEDEEERHTNQFLEKFEIELADMRSLMSTLPSLVVDRSQSLCPCASPPFLDAAPCPCPPPLHAHAHAQNTLTHTYTHHQQQAAINSPSQTQHSHDLNSNSPSSSPSSLDVHVSQQQARHLQRAAQYADFVREEQEREARILARRQQELEMERIRLEQEESMRIEEMRQFEVEQQLSIQSLIAHQSAQKEMIRQCEKSHARQLHLLHMRQQMRAADADSRRLSDSLNAARVSAERARQRSIAQWNKQAMSSEEHRATIVHNMKRAIIKQQQAEREELARKLREDAERKELEEKRRQEEYKLQKRAEEEMRKRLEEEQAQKRREEEQRIQAERVRVEAERQRAEFERQQREEAVRLEQERIRVAQERLETERARAREEEQRRKEEELRREQERQAEERRAELHRQELERQRRLEEARRAEQLLLQKQRCAVVIQRHARGWLTRRFKPFYRALQNRMQRRHQQRAHAATRIQAVCRGFLIRQRIKRIKMGSKYDELDEELEEFDNFQKQNPSFLNIEPLSDFHFTIPEEARKLLEETERNERTRSNSQAAAAAAAAAQSRVVLPSTSPPTRGQYTAGRGGNVQSMISPNISTSSQSHTTSSTPSSTSLLAITVPSTPPTKFPRLPTPPSKDEPLSSRSSLSQAPSVSPSSSLSSFLGSAASAKLQTLSSKQAAHDALGQQWGIKDPKTLEAMLRKKAKLDKMKKAKKTYTAEERLNKMKKKLSGAHSIASVMEMDTPTVATPLHGRGSTPRERVISDDDAAMSDEQEEESKSMSSSRFNSSHSSARVSPSHTHLSSSVSSNRASVAPPVVSHVPASPRFNFLTPINASDTQRTNHSVNSLYSNSHASEKRAGASALSSAPYKSSHSSSLYGSPASSYAHVDSSTVDSFNPSAIAASLMGFRVPTASAQAAAQQQLRATLAQQRLSSVDKKRSGWMQQ